MATGTDHKTLEALLDAMIRVKFNQSDLTTSEKLQENDKDLAITLWNRIGNTSLAGSFINTTYGDLINLTNTGALIAGNWYIFEYTPTFAVSNDLTLNTDITSYYDTVGANFTEVSYTVPTETLAVFALTPTTLSSEARSLTYPEDSIIYDITKTTITGTATPIQGEITYRKCNKFNVECYFDFRHLITRVNLAEEDLDTILATKYNNLVSGEELILVNSLTAETMKYLTPSPDTLVDLDSLPATSSKFIYVKCIPTPSSDVTNIKVNNRIVQLQGDSINLETYLTSVVLQGKTVRDITIEKGCNNICIILSTIARVSIGKFSSFINFSNASGVNTIPVTEALVGGLTDFEIGGGTRSVYGMSASGTTIGSENKGILFPHWSVSNSIGNSNSNLTFNTMSNSTIGNSNIDIVCFGGTFSSIIGSSNTDILLYNFIGSIGNKNTGIDIGNSSYVKLGDNNEDSFLYGCNNTVIEDNNLDLNLNCTFSNIGSSNEDVEIVGSSVTIGNGNNKVKLEAVDTIVGSGNTNILLIDPILNSTIGNNNTYIYLYAYDDVSIGNGNSLISLQGSNSFGVSIGDFNSRITTTAVSDSSIGNHNEGIVLGGRPVVIETTNLFPTNTLILLPSTPTLFNTERYNLKYSFQAGLPFEFTSVDNLTSTGDGGIINTLSVGDFNSYCHLTVSESRIEDNVSNCYARTENTVSGALVPTLLTVGYNYSFVGNTHTISHTAPPQIITGALGGVTIEEDTKVVVKTPTTLNIDGYYYPVPIKVSSDLSDLFFPPTLAPAENVLKVVAQSPDGSLFYKQIDNAGVETLTKIV